MVSWRRVGKKEVKIWGKKASNACGALSHPAGRGKGACKRTRKEKEEKSAGILWWQDSRGTFREKKKYKGGGGSLGKRCKRAEKSLKKGE